MNYEIIRSRRKTLVIQIRDGKVLVRAPYFLSNQIIDDFVMSRTSWIQEKMNAYQPMGVDLSKSTIRIFGNVYELVLKEDKKDHIQLLDKLYVHYQVPLNEQKVVDMIERYLKNQLLHYLDVRIPYYANQLGIKTPPYKVRKYKRIYGRCSSKHELAFNTYLFHYDTRFIDYVVLHECAHILEFNHSNRFYEIVASVMPNYKENIKAGRHQ